MKVSVSRKEETYRVRHFSLNVEVEEGGKTHKLTVAMIENLNIQHNEYHYEVESMSWNTDRQGVDVMRIESELEGYLIDNVEDILS